MTRVKGDNKNKILALMVMLAFCVVPFAAALADKANLEEIGKIVEDPLVDVVLGKAEVVDIGGPISDVLVANPSVVDVMAVKANRLYIVGANLGDTNIIALDADGNIIKTVNVHVKMDNTKIQKTINELYPNESVDVRALNDQFIVTGEVSTPAVASRIVNMVAHYASEVQDTDFDDTDYIVVNMLNVRGEQQVMLRVKIVEVSRNALKELGLETEISTADTLANIGAVTGSLVAANALGLTAPTQLANAILNYDSGGFGPMQFVARALEEEGIVSTLAEPNLTAISGEQAGFLAGGEFPIPTQLDQNGNLVYEFRPFGVSLNFRPVVLSENRISMQMTTEVSTTSFEQNLQLQGINVPTFNVRRAETTVELPSGGTLMIAGLIQSDSVSGLTQLPGVGDVPVIGDLMKSDTFQRDESEVVVIITPYLVQPFAYDRTAPAAAPVPASYGGDAASDEPAPFTAPTEEKPEPIREDSRVDTIFNNNIRRTYGTKVPADLMNNKKSFGYIVD